VLNTIADLKLVIFHSHLRPGGVRRIIELATPHIVDGFAGAITGVTLATGEASDGHWRKLFLGVLKETPVEFFVEPAFGYFSEQDRTTAAMRGQIQRSLQRLLDPRAVGVVWAHNLGLARNLLLTSELIRVCDERRLPLLAHHHDWWFDNRAQRWLEVRRAGFRTLRHAATAVFGSARTRHVAINQADAGVLQKHFGARGAWLPNLTERAPEAPVARVEQARRWLRGLLRSDAPVWILPCRLLRRKNVLEALLLTRWLRPGAWLVTTGGVSSADEQPYYDRLTAVARAQGLPLRLALLAGEERRKPAVPELLAASEAVLLTSLQEGFGLPFLEAAAAGRPLIARRLANIAPDLARFGFHFPQYYDEILIEPSLFDWPAERRRQQRLFARWKSQLPRGYRAWAGVPLLVAAGGQPRAVPFSRLTLTAQIEVLAQPVQDSWECCAPLNPFLVGWRRQAGLGMLGVTPWPRTAERWLSGPAWAKRFKKIVESSLPLSQLLTGNEACSSESGDSLPLPARFMERGSRLRASDRAALDGQEELIRLKLRPAHLYPLLWDRNS